jgi:hypothetical protein
MQFRQRYGVRMLRMMSLCAHREYPPFKILCAEMIRFFPLLRFTFEGALRSSRRAAVNLRVRSRSR